jgi:signal transduction histidine kinase
LLVRALANLIDNALKVSPPRGVIHIAALSRMMEGEAALELSVSDDGPGFTTLPVEGDEARSTLGGHGLGLVIVRAIAERHRGTVAVGAGETGARVTLMLRAPRLLIAND